MLFRKLKEGTGIGAMGSQALNVSLGHAPWSMAVDRNSAV
jgi:hypothetical protein